MSAVRHPPGGQSVVAYECRYVWCWPAGTPGTQGVCPRPRSRSRDRVVMRVRGPLRVLGPSTPLVELPAPVDEHPDSWSHCARRRVRIVVARNDLTRCPLTLTVTPEYCGHRRRNVLLGLPPDTTDVNPILATVEDLAAQVSDPGLSKPSTVAAAAKKAGLDVA